MSVTSSQQPDTTHPNPKKHAEQFARHFFRAIKIIREEHVNPAPKPLMIRWGINGLYRGVKQPLQKKLAGRMRRLEKMTPADRTKLVVDARLRLGLRKELDSEKEMEFVFKGIFEHLEPVLKPSERCRYYPNRTVRRINGRGVALSIGVVLQKDTATGLLKIETPILNGPAYKAGLRGDDLITRIRIDTDQHGKPLPKPQIHSTKGMTVKHANELLLGMPGTRVRLTVIPAGSAIQKKR